MGAIYFVSFEIRNANLKLYDMCEVSLPKPIRSYADVVKVAELIRENYTKTIGECIVTVINYIRLEEPSPREEESNQEVEIIEQQ